MYSDILLTVDYDRTLTGPDSTIPQANLEAIEYFIAHGGTFTVNTGRSVPMSRCYLDKVPTNAPLLLYNGSGWYDVRERKMTQSHPIRLDAAAMLRELMERFPKLWIEVQGIKHHYLLQKNRVWEAYCQHNGASWDYVELDAVEQPFIKAALYSNFEDIYQSSMYRVIPEEMELLDQVTAWIAENWGEYIDSFRACPRILDLHAKGCSKLRSARELQQALGKKILVCVGDAENDLVMLEGADYAYCPSDGIVADRFENVCPCADGAVAEVIRAKIPQILQNRP